MLFQKSDTELKCLNGQRIRGKDINDGFGRAGLTSFGNKNNFLKELS